MEPIDLVVGGRKWHVVERWKGGVGVWLISQKRGGLRAEAVVEADSLQLLSMAIKEAGFRAVYPEAVEPLCKAIQERIGQVE